MTEPTNNQKHLLTILVEDYFHVGAFENLIQQRNWANFEPRYEQNTIKALDLLDEYDTKATFFVLGWIADRSPALIREIVARGHEVASRGYYHRSLRNLTEQEFREDLIRANKAIEDACGQKVLGYRAAEKLSFADKEWALGVLADEGFAYDASFLPNVKDPKIKRFVHQHHTNGMAIWEFPYSTLDLGLGTMSISGGNYFRQIPYTLMRLAVRRWTRLQTAPFTFYFHVWELDPEQPRISAASNYNRIRHYRKLDKMEWILRENLQLYDFCGIADHLGLKDGLRFESSELKVASSKEKTGNQRSKIANISIVIPCYNETEALPYLANTLRSVEIDLVESGYQPNFIFVDDKSTDGTLELLTELFGNKQNIEIIAHEANQGVAAGIMSGIRAAKTEIVCSMDCDCTYDPHELLNMLPLLSNNVDMVTASPYHKNGGVRNVPSWRLFLSRGASFLYRRVLRSKLDTYTSCFRVYRRSSLVGIRLDESGFLGVAEMLGRLDLKGGTIVEFPAVLEVRLFGASKMKTAKTVLGHLKLLSHLAKIRWNSNSIKPILTSKKLRVSQNSTKVN